MCGSYCFEWSTLGRHLLKILKDNIVALFLSCLEYAYHKMTAKKWKILRRKCMQEFWDMQKPTKNFELH